MGACARVRLAALAATLLAGLGGIAGCGNAEPAGDPTMTIYVSLPRSGPDAAPGREMADGARMALAEAPDPSEGIELEVTFLDSSEAGDPDAAWSQAGIASNARTATSDSTAIAYLGELDPGATRVSVPITNEGGLLQVSPGAVDEELLRESPGGTRVPSEFQTSGERTFGVLFIDPAKQRQADLPRAGQQMLDRYERRFDRPGGTLAALGYEAMAVILDSISRASDPLDRESVVAAFLATTDRESVIGRYSVDGIGRAVALPPG